MSKTRIYVVTEAATADKPEQKRLIRTSSQSAAIAAVTDPRFTAAVATPDELVALVGAGVKVEDAQA